MIINTHTHGDHVSGNVEFPATVEVVTHENTARNMAEMRPVSGITPPAGQPPPGNIFKQNNGHGMPKRTFGKKMTIGKGDDRIDLYYFGRGHTNGDAFVVFPALRFMHAGDIFSGKNIPLLDANNGGSGIEIGKTLRKAAKDAKNVDSIITGHSTVMTVADLLEYAAFNDDFAAAVRAAKKAGARRRLAKAWTIPRSTKTTPLRRLRVCCQHADVWDEIRCRERRKTEKRQSRRRKLRGDSQGLGPRLFRGNNVKSELRFGASPSGLDVDAGCDVRRAILLVMNGHLRSGHRCETGGALAARNLRRIVVLEGHLAGRSLDRQRAGLCVHRHQLSRRGL